MQAFLVPWGAFLVILGHYVFANSYSAESQQRFMIASSTRANHAEEFIISARDTVFPSHREILLLFQCAQVRQRKFASHLLRRTCSPLKARWMSFLVKVSLTLKTN